MHEQKFKRCKTSILGNYSPTIGLLLISFYQSKILKGILKLFLNVHYVDGRTKDALHLSYTCLT